MRPLNPPLCENQQPYCYRSGQAMKCVSETESEWVFSCLGCGQVNIMTKPEFRAAMRRQAQHERREAMQIDGVRKFR